MEILKKLKFWETFSKYLLVGLSLYVIALATANTDLLIQGTKIINAQEEEIDFGQVGYLPNDYDFGTDPTQSSLPAPAISDPGFSQVGYTSNDYFGNTGSTAPEVDFGQVGYTDNGFGNMQPTAPEIDFGQVGYAPNDYFGNTGSTAPEVDFGQVGYAPNDYFQPQPEIDFGQVGYTPNDYFGNSNPAAPEVDFGQVGYTPNDYFQPVPAPAPIVYQPQPVYAQSAPIVYNQPTVSQPAVSSGPYQIFRGIVRCNGVNSIEEIRWSDGRVESNNLGNTGYCQVSPSVASASGPAGAYVLFQTLKCNIPAAYHVTEETRWSDGRSNEKDLGITGYCGTPQQSIASNPGSTGQVSNPVVYNQPAISYPTVSYPNNPVSGTPGTATSAPIVAYCNASATNPLVGQPITLSVSATGGNGQFRSIWDNDQTLNGRQGQSVVVTYTSEGIRTPMANVSDTAGNSIIAFCPQISVTKPFATVPVDGQIPTTTTRNNTNQVVTYIPAQGGNSQPVVTYAVQQPVTQAGATYQQPQQVVTSGATQPQTGQTAQASSQPTTTTENGKPVVVQVAAESNIKELPKTGLPLVAWAITSLVPVGLRLRKWGRKNGLLDNNSETANSIWMERQFNA